MNRKLAIAIFIGAACLAQPPAPVVPDTQNRYSYVDEQALTASTETITVQQPATNPKVVVFDSVSVYCSAACDFLVWQNGSAATTTAQTPTALNASAASSVTVYTASNVGTVSVQPEKHTVAAGSTFVLDLSHFYMDGSTAKQNLSVKINSVTATVRIIPRWVER